MRPRGSSAWPWKGKPEQRKKTDRERGWPYPPAPPPRKTTPQPGKHGVSYSGYEFERGWPFPPSLQPDSAASFEDQEPYDPLNPSMNPFQSNVQNGQFQSQFAQSTMPSGVYRSSEATTATISRTNEEYNCEYPALDSSSTFRGQDHNHRNLTRVPNPNLVPNPIYYNPALSGSRSSDLTHNFQPINSYVNVNSSDRTERVLRNDEFQFDRFQDEPEYAQYSDSVGYEYSNASSAGYSRDEAKAKSRYSPVTNCAVDGRVARDRDPEYQYNSYYRDREISGNGVEGTNLNLTEGDTGVSRRGSSCTPLRESGGSGHSNIRYFNAPVQPEEEQSFQLSKNVGVPRQRVHRDSMDLEYTNYVHFKKTTETSQAASFGDAPGKPDSPKTPVKLYHYTNADGAFGILEDRCIGKKEGCKRFGFGVYFTDLPPETSSGEIAFSNYCSTTEEKLLRTEYCFEFLAKDIPKLETCKETDRREFWKAGASRVDLERNGTYYCRKLRGPDVPWSVEALTIDF